MYCLCKRDEIVVNGTFSWLVVSRDFPFSAKSDVFYRTLVSILLPHQGSPATLVLALFLSLLFLSPLSNFRLGHTLRTFHRRIKTAMLTALCRERRKHRTKVTATFFDTFIRVARTRLNPSICTGFPVISCYVVIITIIQLQWLNWRRYREFVYCVF